MVMVKVKCPFCGSEEVSLYGKNSTGKQRYLCRNKSCARKTFQMEYKNNACRPGVHEEIVEMAKLETNRREAAGKKGTAKQAVVKQPKKGTYVAKIRRARRNDSLR